MNDQKRSEPKEAARLDQLLVSLKRAPLPGASADLRGRLSELYALRLQERPATVEVKQAERDRPWLWLAPVAATGLLAAAWIVIMFVAPHYKDHGSRLATMHAIENRTDSTISGIQTVVAGGSSRSPSLARHHVHRAPLKEASPQKMTIRLPYSNQAIVTGTSTTLRIAMSQDALASLGFPVSGGLRDRRVVAEVTLGDDGLPRAVSVPLPVEIIRERR